MRLEHGFEKRRERAKTEDIKKERLHNDFGAYSTLAATNLERNDYDPASVDGIVLAQTRDVLRINNNRMLYRGNGVAFADSHSVDDRHVALIWQCA
jgi:hypothetical protein